MKLRAQFSGKTSFLRGTFLLILSLAILSLYFLFTRYVPLGGNVGWYWVVVFLLAFLIGEPIYRLWTNRWELHLLILEIYIIVSALMQVTFPQNAYVHWLYAIPVFSAALSFGLPGTVGVSAIVFIIKIFHAGALEGLFVLQPGTLESVLPSMLPLVILALLLGFTVELKEHVQQQVVQVLSQRQAVDHLGDLVRQAYPGNQSVDKILSTLVEATSVRGAYLWNPEIEEKVTAVGLDETACDRLKESFLNTGELSKEYIQRSFPLPHPECQVVFAGLPEEGVVREAQTALLNSFIDYLKQTLSTVEARRERNLAMRKTDLLYDIVPVGILDCDEEGSIRRVNRKARQVWSGDQALETKNFGEVFYDDEGPVPLSERRSQAFLGGPDGIPVDLSVVSLPERQGTGWLAVFSDQRPFIKARKQDERSRRLRAVGEIAASLAHEIRNPLGSLAGYLSLLERELNTSGEDGTTRKALKQLRESYRSLDRLVEQFVEFAQRPEIEPEEFSLQRTIHQAIDLLSLPDNVELELDFPSSPVNLTGIPERLRVAVANVVRNAYQAIDEGGEIQVRIDQQPEEVSLTVEDSGGGIDDDEIESVFDPFYTTREEGLGLGLSIVHRVVEEEFGGSLEVESTPGEGTEVQFLFPQ